ncbi:MAG: transposase [Mycobacterium leprae]
MVSDVKLAEAMDDRASFRRLCGFSNTEPTPPWPKRRPSRRPAWGSGLLCAAPL